MRRPIAGVKLLSPIVCLGIAAATAWAVDPPLVPGEPTSSDAAERSPAPGNRDAAADRQVGSLDDRTSGMNIRASQLIGMNIQNPRGESIGEVHDLVVNAGNRKVQYVAVTYGGFLGLGDKLFAVPFDAFKVHVLVDNPDRHVLVLDVTQQQLDGAAGFDQDHWPNFADEKFIQDLDRMYKIDRSRGDQISGQTPATPRR